MCEVSTSLFSVFSISEPLLCLKCQNGTSFLRHEITLILKQNILVRVHVVVDGVDAEAAVFVGAVVQEQATHIAVLQVDVLDGGRPAVLGNLVDHAQAIHQILHKGELHLTGASVRHVEVVVGNEVHIALREEVDTLSPAQIDLSHLVVCLPANASAQAQAEGQNNKYIPDLHSK